MHAEEAGAVAGPGAVAGAATTVSGGDDESGPGVGISGSATRQATIYDVAEAAGVSHQTVSRFLRGFEGIRPQTKQRVVEALERLNYRPNLAARSLTTGQSHRLGALTHEISQVGPSKILQGASAAAREAGYLLDIVTLDVSDRRSIDEALELVMQHDLAGVLALASTDEMTEAFEGTDFRVPAYIAAEQDDARGGHPSHLTTVGLPSLIEHLASLGHRKFIHIAGPFTYSAARNRARAYEAAIAQQGLHSEGIVYGDWTASSGYEELGRRLPHLGATAVVAANDQMALGAMLALSESGISVPDDVSVTGIDDIPEAAYFSPPLTTLRVDFAAQGRTAVQELLGLINRTEPLRGPALPSELVPRRSTGRMRGPQS
ncbi:LacI family DNA-binding transcriptional regulator [Arthrobacter sp. ISL-48]|uniref:LacI family DNA-binding transcriptional regulator n=1 Tax=Arthrobacter sp. ISL-48 TaxID=2819110 RepID=UPI001BE77C8F|nr:LacI family DNA-binding transcriptional regulator [Arthrobacter sp. ISL-48]MBT2532765.1 LacI family DNA-binding transcriptional regulator [Arthrobacter sp. ISL-48]